MPARTSESAKLSSIARLSWATIDAGVLCKYVVPAREIVAPQSEFRQSGNTG